MFRGKSLFFSLQEYQIIPSLNFLMRKIKVSQSTLIEKIIPAELTPRFSLLIFKSIGEQMHTWKLGVEMAVLSLMIYAVITVAVFRSWTVVLPSVQAETKRYIAGPSRPAQGF